jgi:hypothetical protein
MVRVILYGLNKERLHLLIGEFSGSITLLNDGISILVTNSILRDKLYEIFKGNSWIEARKK